jgi:hypothetical protein
MCSGCVEGEETAARGVAAAIRLWGKVSQPLFIPDYFHDHSMDHGTKIVK